MVDRRSLIKGVAGGLGAAALGTQTQSAAAVGSRNRKPNILMIVTDQETGISNFPAGIIDRLPAHAKLLERGLHVVNHHVNTTPCSPSRSNIYTGQHTQLTKINTNTDISGVALSPELPTIGKMLRQAGYYTAYKGKWHLSKINGERGWVREPSGSDYPDTRAAMEKYGFSDYFFDGEEIGLTWGGYMSDRTVAADASRWLFDQAPALGSEGTPWFLAVNLVNPHDIMFYDATGSQADTRLRRNQTGLMMKEPADPFFHEKLGIGLPRSFYADDLLKKPEAHRAIRDNLARFYGEMAMADEASWLRFVNYYYNCIRDVDRNMMTLLWALSASGQLENTIIMFTSDHGERGGAHGLRQKSATAYREETNVPMVVVHPDVAGGRSTENLMSAVDIVPTLLGLAGLDRAWQQDHYPDLRGVDVSAIISDPARRTERDERGHLFNYAVMLQWPALPPGSKAIPPYDLTKRRLHRGVFDGRHKFVRYFAPSEHHVPKDWATLLRHNDLELYDTKKDRFEIDNLASNADAHRDLILRLNAKTNALVEHEIGVDQGADFPGPHEQYSRV